MGGWFMLEGEAVCEIVPRYVGMLAKSTLFVAGPSDIVQLMLHMTRQ